MQNTVIVGAGDIGQLLGRKLGQHPSSVCAWWVRGRRSEAMRQDLAESHARHARELGRSWQHDVNGSSSPSPRRATAGSSSSFTRSGTWTCRSTSCRGCSKPSDRPSVCITSRAFLSSRFQPVRPTKLARATKRAIDIAGATRCPRTSQPAVPLHRLEGVAGLARTGLLQTGTARQEHEPFELLKFRTMRADTDDAPHREYVRSIMDTSRCPPTTISTSSTAPTP